VKKIISLFQRNYDTDRLVRDDVVPGAEWVLAGEGVATRKYDGSACIVEGGRLFRRYEVKPGRRPAPPDFMPAGLPDPITGEVPGGVPVGHGPADKWHREAFESSLGPEGELPPDGTYELIGPKVQGNPEHAQRHLLVPHGNEILPDCPRTFAEIRAYLATLDIEGIVWHHPDGRMVKVKKRDFGLKW